MAEVKRMHVRFGHGGRRLGAALLAQLVGDVRSLGSDHVRLDAGSFMAAAHRTYETAGFVDRDPYDVAEVPHRRIMELSLRYGGRVVAVAVTGERCRRSLGSNRPNEVADVVKAPVVSS